MGLDVPGRKWTASAPDTHVPTPPKFDILDRHRHPKRRRQEMEGIMKGTSEPIPMGKIGADILEYPSDPTTAPSPPRIGGRYKKSASILSDSKSKRLSRKMTKLRATGAVLAAGFLTYQIRGLLDP